MRVLNFLYTLLAREDLKQRFFIFVRDDLVPNFVAFVEPLSVFQYHNYHHILWILKLFEFFLSFK